MGCCLLSKMSFQLCCHICEYWVMPCKLQAEPKGSEAGDSTYEMAVLRSYWTHRCCLCTTTQVLPGFRLPFLLQDYLEDCWLYPLDYTLG